LSTRRQNETKFSHWQELPGGGRLYSRVVPGRMGWHAVYVKEVDENEQIVSFQQEIYNEQGTCVEIHRKYPVDTGHDKVNDLC